MTEKPSTSIWHAGPPDIDSLNARGDGSMVAALGITITRAGDDFLEAAMPVDERTVQPFGILHGGASAALAETVASWAGILCVDADRFRVSGIALDINHVRAVRSGHVLATARPLHLGRSTQVWEVRIRSDSGALVAASRLTLAVIPAR